MPKPGFRPATVSPTGLATQKQVNTLDGMFTDLGFTRIQRNSYLGIRFGRIFRGLDELTVREASMVIGILDERRKREQSQHAPIQKF